jgi:hypothetical protein
MASRTRLAACCDPEFEESDRSLLLRFEDGFSESDGWKR